jgi:hypothetical protein
MEIGPAAQEARMNAIGIVSCCGFFLAVACEIYASQWLKSRRSKWHLLHCRYPAPPDLLNTRAEFVEDAALSLNGCSYKNWPTVACKSQGLAIFVRPKIFRFHKPILVPWDDITVSQSDLETKTLALQLGDSDRLTLEGRAAEATRQVLSRRRVRQWRQRKSTH